jgi:hypothetical protein
MPKPRNIISSLVLFGAVGVLTAMFWPTCSVLWSFDHLEQRAKKRISGTDLQAWASVLIATPPAKGWTTVRELGTNFPPQLLGLYHHPPDIMVYGPTTNSPGWVLLGWGGGLIGHCGFEIGPTNFTGYYRGHKWQDGVYFWRDQDQR